MKKFLLAIVAVSMLFSMSAFAQSRNGQGDRSDWRERVAAERKALIKEELRIQDSDPFWAVYDELQARSMELMKARMAAHKALSEAVKDNKPDNEVEPLLKEFLEADAACIAFKSSKRERLLSVLSPSQFARLLFAEEKFMGHQMGQWGRGPHPGGGHGRGNGGGRGHGQGR